MTIIGIAILNKPIFKITNMESKSILSNEMSIDAKELRIGNWVMGDTKYIKVESVDEQGINLSVSGGYYPGETEVEYEAYFNGRSFWSHYVEIIPVPLTTEILEKCGFIEEEKWFYQNECPIKIFYDLEQVCFESQLLDIRIKSLHQLQNIYYALTNSELEINLK